MLREMGANLRAFRDTRILYVWWCVRHEAYCFLLIALIISKTTSTISTLSNHASPGGDKLKIRHGADF
jgi:hypothetical protein